MVRRPHTAEVLAAMVLKLAISLLRVQAHKRLHLSKGRTPCTHYGFTFAIKAGG